MKNQQKKIQITISQSYLNIQIIHSFLTKRKEELPLTVGGVCDDRWLANDVVVDLSVEPNKASCA